MFLHLDTDPPKKPLPSSDRFINGAEFAVRELGFQPDPKQAAVLDSQAARGILLCCRQWGKSTVSAAKAVHRAWTAAGSLVLVASPSERQSAEWVRKAEQFVQTLGVKPRGDGANAQSILLPNGSRIVGLPGAEATVRGFSAVSLLLIERPRACLTIYTNRSGPCWQLVM